MAATLFAVMLGGRAPRANTELHDMVFAIGTSIEDTYERLIGKWFGSAEGLHLDCWTALDVVDGHEVRLTLTKPSGPRLYFIN